MSGDAASSADRVRQKLLSLGVPHTVGTSWDKAGASIVVVDLPSGVDRESVADSIGDMGTALE